MKQIAIILSLISILIVVTAPVLAFAYHNVSEMSATEAHSDCEDDCKVECSCFCHISLQAVVTDNEIVKCCPVTVLIDRNHQVPAENLLIPLDQPPKLFS